MNDGKTMAPPVPVQSRPPAGINAGAWLGGAILLAIAVLPLLVRNAFLTHLAIMVCINAIIVSGLSLLARSGQISLCQGAFVGIGAYMSVLMTLGLNLPFILGVAVAVLSAGLVAWLLGAIMLRLTGVYFVLLTFAFGQLVYLVFLEWDSVTGGANGIPGIPPAGIFGFAFDGKPSFYCLALVLTLGVFLLLRAIYRSPAGHAIDSVGENAKLAEASGISVRGTQLFALTLSGAIAGLGGSLIAHYTNYISPESFNMNESVTLIIIMVVGGRKSLLGPLIGAMVMTPLPELFRGAVESQNIYYGVALILMLRFLPLGLASLPSRGRRKQEIRA